MMHNPPRAADNLLRLPEVRAQCASLSRATIYRRMKAGTFPQAVPLTDSPNGPVAWREADVAAWKADPAGYRVAR